MKAHQLDLFANPNAGVELHWFPGSMPPENGQKILKIYENDDGTPSDIIISEYYQKFIDQGFEKPPLLWTPMPQHPVKNYTEVSSVEQQLDLFGVTHGIRK